MFVMALFDKRYLFKEIDRPTVDAVNRRTCSTEFRSSCGSRSTPYRSVIDRSRLDTTYLRGQHWTPDCNNIQRKTTVNTTRYILVNVTITRHIINLSMKQHNK